MISESYKSHAFDRVETGAIYGWKHRSNVQNIWTIPR